MGCCGWRTSDGEPTVVDAKPVDDTVLGRHLGRAGADLMAATRGTPMCRVGNGPDAHSVKYAEGRFTAVREVDRALRGMPVTATLATAGRVLQDWEEAKRTAGQQGATWAAYRTGGVDELHALIDDLTTS